MGASAGVLLEPIIKAAENGGERGCVCTLHAAYDIIKTGVWSEAITKSTVGRINSRPCTVHALREGGGGIATATVNRQLSEVHAHVRGHAECTQRVPATACPPKAALNKFLPLALLI